MSNRNRREGRRTDRTNQRARGTNARALGAHPRSLHTSPRAIGTNPRAIGTNPHPGKAETTGQWRAAFRRIGSMTPDRRHELERALEQYSASDLPGVNIAELRRNLAT